MYGHRRVDRSRMRRPGFTLVELVIVVTIIGIVAGIAVPRMSNASTSASAAALRATLSGVRTAIDYYYAEHRRYPGYNPGTGVPDGSAFVEQLILYSDFAGNPNAAPGAPFFFGPYLRKPFPKNPINGLSTVWVKANPSAADPAEGSVGWITVLSHGYFGIAATDAELDSIGVTGVNEQNGVKGGASP